jgi:hypothetical protein
VLDHADCPDGFGVAFAAWRVLGDAASYAPVRHGEPPPSQVEVGPEGLDLLDSGAPAWLGPGHAERLAASPQLGITWNDRDAPA